MLELIDVSKSYRDNVIFKNVSFMVGSGLVFLVGESGSGKSTLLNIIYGIDSYKGKVKVDGSISYMNQEGSLFDDKTVYDNLRLNLDVFNDLLDLLDLGDKKYELVKNLSLGERKRVNFINCVGKSRDIYLLDEPFAHLDEINKEKMFNVLMELSKEKLVIVASHEYIDRCSSIISIRDKSVVVSNLDGKSYDVVKFKEPWYRYFIDNIKMVMLKVGVFLLLLCVSSYMSSYFKKVPEYKDIDMNVYGYKCGEEYCTPRYSDIMEYVSEGYRVFIEFELMGISEVYYEGRNIEDYVYVAYDGDGVCINDVFSSKYGNKGIDIVVDGIVYEEDVMGVYVDNCILPTIYIPYDKYASFCSDDRFIVIDNPMEGNDTLERLEVYPLIKGNSTKKVNKLVDVNEVIVSCSMYGIWLMIVILWFEYNIKFYSNFRLNMSAISTIKYLLLERVPMFLISLLFSDWYIWVVCLCVEIIFMKKYLDYRLKVVEKL